MDNLLGEIAALYKNPLTEESSIIINYRSESEKLDEICARLDGIVKEKRELPQFREKNPLIFSQERAKALRSAIKKDPDWVPAYKDLVNELRLELDFEKMKDDLIKSIDIPWWDSKTLTLVKEDYRGDSLDITARISHSYIVQLMRNGLAEGEDSNKESTLSVTGILITSDNKVILGERGGHFLKGAVMTVPAGYVDYPESLFDSFYRECKEEIGLDTTQICSSELIGREVSFGQKNNHESNTLYIVKAKTRLTYEGVAELWKSSAADRGEHKKLIGVENNPEAILSYIEDSSNNVIPPGTASLLTYCCHENPAIMSDAVSRFEKQYKFSV